MHRSPLYSAEGLHMDARMNKKPCSRDSGQLLFAGAIHPGHLDTLSVSEGKVAAVSGQGNRTKFEMSGSGRILR
jgi:hypothetical protein